ncbi:MAG: UDP-2,3-diacylglucosamine diphosphatase [Rhodospirillales bacterium]|nr:UDP-2,3-diacylglucosamine diphosphatase [Rhodospirillales bacterium]
MIFTATPDPLYKAKSAFISDVHLGSNISSAEYLYEMLLHTDAEELYIVGDFFGGWEMEAAKEKAFDEMQKRVIALILAKASNNTKVTFIPGNHDEKWRLDQLFGRQWKQKWMQNITVAEDALYTTPGDMSQTYLVGHGDNYSSRQKNMAEKALEVLVARPVSQFGSLVYDLFVSTGKLISNSSYRLLGVHVSPVAAVKKGIKKVIDFAFDVGESTRLLRNELWQKAIEKNVDGIIFGHTHTAGESDKTKSILPIWKAWQSDYRKPENSKTLHLLNDGDWVESCTFLMFKENGEHKIVDYRIDREKKGMTELPEADDPLPDDLKPFMRYANIIIRHAHRTWPGKQERSLAWPFEKRNVVRAEYQARQKKMDRHLRSHKRLNSVMRKLEKNDPLSERQQKFLTSHFDKIGDDKEDERTGGWMASLFRDVVRPRDSRQARLHDIFQNHANGSPLNPDETLFVRTVVRQIGQSTERKIIKQARELEKLARKMDMPVARKWARLAA